MSKSDFEHKSLVHITLFGYIGNLAMGWTGFFFAYGSMEQLVLFQLGNAFAITASVIAGRYTGLRGQHVAASAYILLGIAHGISLAALSKAGINAEREATMAIPMIPALLFMFWCSLFPRWLHILAVIPSICFTVVYIDVHLANPVLGWTLYVGYATLQICEVLWGYYLFEDWKAGRTRG